MGIVLDFLKRIYFSVFTKKYHLCKLCNGAGILKVPGFLPASEYEKFYSNVNGEITVKCPACDGSGIVWG